MIIKVTRLQSWAPAGGGERVGRRPPPPLKKMFFGYIGGLCATFSSYMGAFLLRFSHFWGPFHHGGLFYFMVGAFFLACPRSPTKISAGAHDNCKEGSRACFPEIFCVTAI